MSDIFKALGLFTAIVVLVLSLINQVPLLTSLYRSAIVAVAIYVGGFCIYFVSIVILQPNPQPQNKNPDESGNSAG